MSDQNCSPALFYGYEAPPVREWGGRLPVALVFPERVDHGLSTLGWQVVYRLLAARNNLAVERFFWDSSSSRPRSVDSGQDLGLYPLILLSLNFEGDFPIVLQMLSQAQIPMRAKKRPDWPLVLAGGPISFLNPFPLLPALDAIFCGEAEAGLVESIEHVASAWIHGESKSTALEAIAHQPGMFVPGKSLEPVQRQLVPGIEQTLSTPAYSCFISPRAQFRDMLLLEVNRGCPYGCRFCAAGSIYKPPRQAVLTDLQDIVARHTPRKVGLVGTALTDWPDLLPFLHWLHERQTKFALASLRADGLNDEFLEFLRRTGTRSITLALEGASQRLRAAMNKHFCENVFLEAVERISRLQFNTLKLYLITGWPGENESDWQEFEDFLAQIDAARKRGQGDRNQGVGLISLSVSCLVPKAWTPLQWAPIPSQAWFKQAMKRFKAAVACFKGMRFSGENPGQARAQAFLARGDEEIFPCLELAAQEGLPSAMRHYADLAHKVLSHNPGRADVFPWERLDIGVSRRFLLGEWIKYQHVLMTAPCPSTGCQECRLCGMDQFLMKK